MDLTTQQKKELAAAVERGATFLDEHRPGWRVDLRQTINDTSPLDMTDCEACVLGKVMGGYHRGIDEFFADLRIVERETEAARHGFTLPMEYSYLPETTPGEKFLAWRYLEECWLRKIEQEIFLAFVGRSVIEHKHHPKR